MKKRTLRILIVVVAIALVFFYFYSKLIHIGNVKGLVSELENQSALQDYFAHKNEDSLKANFIENIERAILNNKKYKLLREGTFLVKVDQDYVTLGVKVGSEVSKFFLEKIFRQNFYKDSTHGNIMLLEEYKSYRKPLQTQYKKFGSRKNYSNDSITKKIKTIVKNAESNFGESSYYIYDKILWLEIRYDIKTESYSFKFDRNKYESYFNKEADAMFSEQLDSVQLEYYNKLEDSLTPYLKGKKVNMVLFKSYVPYFSEIPPPGL